MPSPSFSLDLARHLADLGWHVFPLTATDKRPLANCPRCRARDGLSTHRIEQCPCLPAGAWCHGVRAATLDPARIERWWTANPRAAVGVAAGPSRLLLVDIDTHADTPPEHPATELLPGIDLTAEPIDPAAWQDAEFRDGRDSLRLLAALRGGAHPWPTDPGHQPVTVHTPSGGRHLWYRTPAGNLHQAIGQLAWQVDIKAGWSYGLAPGTVTRAGTYRHRGGDLAAPGRLPSWLEGEIRRVATTQPPPAAPPASSVDGSSTGSAAYLDTLLERGAADLARLRDGRKRALAALAYKAGGYLAWSGRCEQEVLARLVTAGLAAALVSADAERIARRSLANGIARPLTPPPHRSTTHHGRNS
jgi:hypothetical protein